MIWLAPLVGLIGVLVGAWLTGRHQQTRLRYEFVSRQLGEFYSPLLGLRMEVWALSELRERIAGETDAAYRELLERASAGGPQAVEEFRQRRGEEFMRDIDYNNRQLKERLLPAYREMVRIFRENIMLAESETREYFAPLVEYVEIWDRHISGNLPTEVGQRLGHTEAVLHPFYTHLQDVHDKLRSRLAQGKF